MKVMVSGARLLVAAPKEVRREVYSNTEGYILNHHSKDVFLIGMAEGFDECVAKICIRNNIDFEAYLPNSTYGRYYWGKNSLLNKDRFYTFSSLLDEALLVHYACSSIYGEDGVHSNFHRNLLLIQDADCALVYNKNRTAGTTHAINNLKAQNVPYTSYPFTQQTSLMF